MFVDVYIQIDENTPGHIQFTQCRREKKQKSHVCVMSVVPPIATDPNQLPRSPLNDLNRSSVDAIEWRITIHRATHNEHTQINEPIPHAHQVYCDCLMFGQVRNVFRRQFRYGLQLSGNIGMFLSHRKHLEIFSVNDEHQFSYFTRFYIRSWSLNWYIWPNDRHTIGIHIQYVAIL